MRAHLSRHELIWLPVVLVAALAVYLPGLDNSLVYDDGYLTEGLFSDFGRWPGLRARLLSYGSFVWLNDLLGPGWWKQRLLNIAIHLAVVVALWALYREILRVIAPPAGGDAPADSAPYHRSPALGIAIGFFALNPVAVYSVAYLIQRSILLATLFVVLGLWFFSLALSRKKPWLHVAALACYALAVLSKEHAVTAPLAAIPIYILIARPTPRRLASLIASGGLAVAVAGYILWRRFGDILGAPFDEYSHVYLAQLRALDPNVERHAYALSVIDQTWLFFQYGLRWLLPSSGWLSINLRPPFPVTWLTFPQILGVIGYLATLAGGFFLLLRHRDWRALVGISLLLPALLFTTEFATVWVQDPFVLYRSYLWAIGIPGIVFCLVHGPSARVLLAVGLAIASLLVWQGLDRVLSMATPVRAWTDAIEKLPKDARSVGRWFPYLNRGAAYVDHDEFDAALRDFEVSESLGDMGIGSFNKGAVLLATGHPDQALPAFARAEKQGYGLYNLPFQRGLALMALRRPAEAYAQFEATQALTPPSPVREMVLLQLGRSAVQVGRYADALVSLESLLSREPRNNEARYLQAIAYLSKGDAARAHSILDAWLSEGESGPALYVRAMANHSLKRRAEAIADIDGAIRHGIDNPTVRQWKARIEAMPP
ncbi:MAG: tetratricopeptide repeat protein [Usitatibacter sp.]